MLQNAYFLAKIGADTAENEQHFAVIDSNDRTQSRGEARGAPEGDPRARGQAEAGGPPRLPPAQAQPRQQGPRLLACRFAMFNIGLQNSSDGRFQGFVCKTRQSDLVTPSAMMMNYRNSVEAAGASTSRLFSGGDSLGDLRVVVHH